MTVTLPPEAAEAPSQPPRRRRWSLPMALLLLVAVTVILAGVFPFRQILAQQRQVELTQTQYDALVEENRRLEQDLALLETPEEVERIAREEYGLVRPGEIGYRAVSPPEVEAPAAPVPAEPEERRWWERLWDFLTGRDIDVDG